MITIFMASLGCAKNLVDAETMLGETLGHEFGLALDPAEADVIIINTCGFIEDARNEAREVIGEYLELKRKASKKIRVVATGCWAQRSPEQMLREFPSLDAVWGLEIPSSLAHAIRSLSDKPSITGIGFSFAPREGTRLLTTLPAYSYLRISDGCDNRCHYCAIPLIRGGLRSRNLDAVIDEAKLLEDQGARELVIISQDTTAYGRDLDRPGVDLAALLTRLLDAVRVPRLRVLYAHPAHLDERVIDMIVSEPRLCRYLDLPIQHASDAVLARMGRGYGRDRVLEIAEKFHNGGVTLRTTILTGFPGETEEDLRQVLDIVSAGYFRHLGAFAYSPEPGTAAYGLHGQVPQQEAARRRDEVLAAQMRVAFAWLDSRIGTEERILADSFAEPGWLIGRSTHEAPDADGVVYVKTDKSRPGDIITACIKQREGYDLIAQTTPHPKKGKRRK